MFRRIAAIFLLLAFSAQIFNQVVVVLDYYTNTAAFAKNCENKARPMMHCNGKCQMMKKLKEEEKKEQQAPDRKGNNKNEVVYSKSLFVIPFIVYFVSGCSYVTVFDKKTIDRSFPIFHPPSA